MGLRASGVWNRLRVLLAYHDKLRAENKDKKSMDRTARLINHLLWKLKKYDSIGVQPTGLNE